MRIDPASKPDSPRERARPEQLDALEIVRLAAARAGRPADEAPPVPPSLLSDTAQGHAIGLAASHRIGGTVFEGLSGVAGVRDDVLAELEAQRQAWRWHHLASLRDLHEIGAGLDELGLRWMVYKGPVLAAEVYPHPGDRAYGDLDLLVHPKDLGRAVRVIEELGFVHGNHHWRHAAWILRGEFPMERGETTLDVHWHLQYAAHERADLAVDLDALFDRVRRLAVGGTTIAAPSPEDSLMLTAHHACRSGGHRLIWSKDIERLLAVGEVDLERFVRIVVDANLSGQVAVAIARAAAQLETDAGDVLAALDRPWLVRTERFVTRRSTPLRIDERDTVARRWARSVRGSPGDSVAYVARRARHRLAELLGGAPPSRLDDESEKQAFFDRVAAQV